jgi:hypothetical protein
LNIFPIGGSFLETPIPGLHIRQLGALDLHGEVTIHRGGCVSPYRCDDEYPEVLRLAP